MELDGRVAMVTGAARGIGEAIADALAAAGAGVAAADLDGSGAASVAGRLSQRRSVPAMGISMDVSDSTSVRNAVASVTERLGVIDVLVNNAGIDVIEPFIDNDESTWDRLLAVNLKGPMICARAVLDGMVEAGRGSIVNIGSDAGRVGSSGEVAYSATKGGVIAFTKALAREVASRGVRVNCVCPGPTDTALMDQVAEASQKLYDSLVRAIPMRRIGEPDDVAKAVVFLASDGARFITGQSLSVSGGLTMA